MAIFSHQETRKLPSNGEKTANKAGDVAVAIIEAKDVGSAALKVAKARAVKIEVNNEAESSCDYALGFATALAVCMVMSLSEIAYLIYLPCSYGFDTINTAFYWTEVALAPFTLGLGVLLFASMVHRSSALLVPFLLFFLPRVTAPVIFYAIYAMSRCGEWHSSVYLGYASGSFLGAFMCFFMWYGVHGVYKEFLQEEAVYDYVKKRKMQTTAV